MSLQKFGLLVLKLVLTTFETGSLYLRRTSLNIDLMQNHLLGLLQQVRPKLVSPMQRFDPGLGGSR